MGVVLTLFWHWPGDISQQPPGFAVQARLRDILSGIAGLREALIFTPAQARDIYTHDGASPPLGLQLEFPDIRALEAAAGEGGALQALFHPGVLGGALEPTLGEAQAFLRRNYPVETPVHGPGADPCSFVVHYPGKAQDANAWLAHYIEGHVPLMQRMPGVRAVEVLTPAEWVGRLPIRKATHMQRNRILFDSPAALTAALQSPIRHKLRADFERLPPFDGGSCHHAMSTETVPLGRTANR